MTQHKKCEEKVSGKLKDRIEDLQKLWEAYCNGEEDVEDLGNIYEYGLSFDYVPRGTFNDQKEGYFRYQLSWGGPSDEFRFFTGPDFYPYRIVYAYLDWFDGATRTLREEDESLLLEIFDWFRECGSVQAEFEKGMEE